MMTNMGHRSKTQDWVETIRSDKESIRKRDLHGTFATHVSGRNNACIFVLCVFMSQPYRDIEVISRSDLTTTSIKIDYFTNMFVYQSESRE